MTHGQRAEDHLAALSMAAPTAVGAGLYTPDRLDLRLTGADQTADLVVYAHEVHHQALNDSTAWGAALHVLSALGPPQRACFGPMLDASRQVHEAYATFAAINIATVHDSGAAAVLAHYPAYQRLHDALAALAAAACGPHRQYLLATAVARAAMQSPVLSVMLDQDDLRVLPSDLRAIDQPDGRWRWLLRAGRRLTDRAAAEADAQVTATHGRDGLVLDDPSRAGAAAVDELDGQWEMWEAAAYQVLAEALDGAGATVLGFNGHMEPTGQILERARAIEPGLTLRAARPHSPAPNDAALSAATIQFVRLTIADPPRPARLAEAPERLDEPPVLHVRLPQRLLDSFLWSPPDAAHLQAAGEPVVALRDIEHGSTIAHAIIADPSALPALRDTARPLCIVGASCFVDTDWSARWLSPLREAGELVVLIDVEAERFTASWVRAGLPIRAGALRVQDTGGAYWATALFVADDPSVWLHLGDETTVKLLLDQLRRTDGLQIDVSPEHVRDAAPLLTRAVTHLLATESFLDLRGLDDETIRRVTSISRDGA